MSKQLISSFNSPYKDETQEIQSLSKSNQKLKKLFSTVSNKNEFRKTLSKNLTTIDHLTTNKFPKIDLENSDFAEKIRERDKEIRNLKILNNHLIISLQERDEMISHIIEENRKLQELFNILQRSLHSMNKFHTLSPRKVFYSLSFFSNSNMKTSQF